MSSNGARDVIAALLFDATGTLLELRESVGSTYARLAAQHGVELPAWRIDEAFERILRAAPPRVTPETRVRDAVVAHERAWWREVVRSTFLATDSTVRFADFDAFFADTFAFYESADAWQLAPGTEALLRELHGAGYATGVVSNFDHRLLTILEHIGIATLFDIIMIPAVCGFEKPDRRIFEAALRALGTPASAAVYVGDDPEKDLEAARRAGLWAIDIAEIKNLRALPAHLESIATLARTALRLPRPDGELPHE